LPGHKPFQVLLCFLEHILFPGDFRGVQAPISRDLDQPLFLFVRGLGQLNQEYFAVTETHCGGFKEAL
jgi:hypothetical protein